MMWEAVFKEGSSFKCNISLEQNDDDREECDTDDKDVRVVRVTITGGVDPTSGQRVGVLCSEDVTAMHEAMMLSEEMHDRKDLLFANMSHELKTPLNGIIALSDMLITELENEDKLSAEQLDSMKVILSSGRRLNNLVINLLDLSLLKKKKMEIHLDETVNLHALVDNIVKLSAPMAKDGVAVRNLVDIAFPKFLGDPSRLSQIITNLVSNALKFTFVGSIDVQAKLHKGRNMLKIDVVDSGIGIPEDKQEIVFEALRQVDESADRKFGGTGLGLAISRDLSRLMGGELSLKSKVGEGTTFSCTIPFHEKESDEERRKSNVSVSSTGTFTKGSDKSGSARRTSSRPSSNCSESQSRGSDGITRSSKSSSSRRKEAHRVFLPSHSEVHDGKIEVLSVDDEPVNQKVVASIRE